MARKNRTDNADSLVFTAVIAGGVLFLVSLFHYVLLRLRHTRGKKTRRVFDLGIGSATMLKTGLVALAFGALCWGAYGLVGPSSLFISIPLALLVANWLGMAQACAFFGVAVNFDDGTITFRNTQAQLDLGDYFRIFPIIRCFTTLNTLKLDDVEWLTRESGRQLYLHGSFGSRRIDFSDKLKRDECIHLITALGGKRIRVGRDLGL